MKFFFSMLCSLIGCGLAAAAEPEAREWATPGHPTLPYRWSAPENPAADAKYPLILFLHGAGERGADNQAQLKHGIRSLLKISAEINQPCFFIIPQCPQDNWWTPGGRGRNPEKSPGMFEPILTLLADVMKNHPVDPARVYVTGLSMGGFATWGLLAAKPELFAAAIPICGGGNPATAATFKDVPVWAVHGEADPVVPVKTTREMVAALEKAGAKPKTTYYPEVGHDSWTATYANPEFIKWLFAQRKGSD